LTGSRDEAQARKRRSIEVLQRENVPWIEWLPVISTAAEVKPRKAVEIVRRAMCLFALAAAGALGERDRPRAQVEGAGLVLHLSPRERAFLLGEEPPARDYIAFSWGIEAALALLWAAGLADRLPRPNVTVGDEIGQLLAPWNVQALVDRSRLRSLDAVLDEADLIYRYHWATRQASLDGREPPAGLETGVVVERHRALSWLIRYEEHWDDVTTDT
jgi:hypothetical protein